MHWFEIWPDSNRIVNSFLLVKKLASMPMVILSLCDLTEYCWFWPVWDWTTTFPCSAKFKNSKLKSEMTWHCELSALVDVSWNSIEMEKKIICRKMLSSKKVYWIHLQVSTGNLVFIQCFWCEMHFVGHTFTYLQNISATIQFNRVKCATTCSSYFKGMSHDMYTLWCIADTCILI